MAKPNIRQIEAFNAVMRAGSVTRASEALHVSQPAVTKLLQAFEDSCGFPLFNRNTGRLIPTQEARQLHTETERLSTAVLRIEKTARAIRDLERGEVSVVAFPAISMQLIPRTVADFMRDRPDLRVSLLTRTSPSIGDSVITGSADFGLSLRSSEASSLHCEVFSRTTMVCGLNRNHPLAEKPVIPLEDLQGEPLIALGRNDLSQGAIEAAFNRRGVSMHTVAEVQMAEAACAMVAMGQGITIVPSVVTVGPMAPNMVFRPLDQEIPMSIWKITSLLTEQSILSVRLMGAIRLALEEVEASLASPFLARHR
ncbi:MAG: LysR family transcriptional regulator [Rhodospirillum sp.]|nr:LysR family transcriptional regulator [Rhodospirillum sp.]MCF8490797.1 LysR family transcriptional regulator [Rhodospirillum sp.]MCF8499858.1 LysR family transcriptional regulator [Rhodospirillum sp.]